MLQKTSTVPKGWLAFELNVLRRLKFDSIALPFSSDARLGSYLKRWNACVLTNDVTQSAWTKAVAAIQNNSDKLSDEEANLILEDVYVPHYRLQNPALRNWFGETDSWWFDNIRQNVEKLTSPVAKAIALSLAMSVGDYVLSFDEETLEFRQPLSKIFEKLRLAAPEPINNSQNNLCRNKNNNEFLAENYADLMFLRLPRAHNLPQRESLGKAAWREEFLRGGDGFWEDLERIQTDRLGAQVETKSQYLRFFEDTLRTASHIGTWAIAHVEEGFISTQEIVESIGRVRRVDTIFTKDFSELTGTKAVIITA